MHVYRTDPESFIELADILKALAHPQRLCIVKTLCEKGESNVTDMQDCLDEAQSKVSQHLSKLKSAGIIAGRREGTSIFYSIYDERVRRLVQAIINEFFV
ncbi:ArsR/SmtB family transcription factor [Peptoclostridium acidaminophilum]|nr:metalloregulator ArsR/SmtB family transcription factor [Peptoclostridium acidaminophilum]